MKGRISFKHHQREI